MLTTTFRDSILNGLDSHFAGLIQSVTNWRTPTVTEANYTGYGTRPGITFGAAADTSPAGGRQRANSADVTFPANSGSDQAQIGWGIWDASTAGNLKWIAMLDADVPIIGTADTADLITAYGHGLETDQRVFVLAAPGAVIPTGLSENTAYFVLATGLTADAFKLSTTSGGAAVDITAGGAAMFIPYKAVTVAGGATPKFSAGTLVIQI